MRAAIYGRFSTDKQNESSIADQIRVCSEFADANEMTVAVEYADEGISGAALGNRPGAKELMEAAFGQQFDVVLVTDLSRPLYYTPNQTYNDFTCDFEKYVEGAVREEDI